MTSPKVRRTHKPHLEMLEPRLVLTAGQPTAQEQLFLELLNDARANPAAYGASIGVDLSYIAPSQPLAFDPRIELAAEYHSVDMNNRAYFAHTDPDGRDPGARLTLFGYPWNTWGESIACGSTLRTPADALRALIVDAGVADLGHRNHLLANGPAYALQNQVGVGVVQNGSGPYVDYYTVDTGGSPFSAGPFITGVVFNDANGNGRYDLGEGLGGVTVTVAGVGSVTTYATGGYSIPVAPGTYTVTASGGALALPVTRTVAVGAGNVRLNFNPIPIPLAQIQDWVSLLYRDLLHRTPGVAEVNAWANLVEAGLPRETVVGGLLKSPEFANNVVTGLFQQYLHRNPDVAGLTGFANLLVNGGDERTVRQFILSSPEYWALHGGTAAGFVQGLYADLLGRAPVGHEADAWVSLASASPATAVAGLLHSPESEDLTVGQLYQTCLRRAADAPGLAAFAQMLANRAPEQFVLEQLLLSYEYLEGSLVW